MELRTASTGSLTDCNGPTTEVPLNASLLLRATADPQSSTSPLPNAPSASRPSIQWAEDTVDNEFMGKKKSNCCCIYEKPRRWDESSSSSSSSSSDDENVADGHTPKKVKHIHCTEHCRGHTKRCYRKSKPSGSGTNEPKPTENPNPDTQNP